MFVLWDRHKFVLILVNWLTDDVASFQHRFLVGLSNATYLRPSTKLLYFETQIATFVGISKKLPLF